MHMHMHMHILGSGLEYCTPALTAQILYHSIARHDMVAPGAEYVRLAVFLVYMRICVRVYT